MKDTDIIKAVFQKAKLEYPTEDMDKIVLARIRKHENQTKLRRKYKIAGCVSSASTIVLFILFNSGAINSGTPITPDNSTIVIAVASIILLTIFIQLEIALSTTSTKKQT